MPFDNKKFMKQPFSWDDQRIFLAVLEEGSLSGAARRLGLSHPTIRVRLEALEAGLGTVLFTRSMTGLTPTEAAEALRQPARAMAVAAEMFKRHASAPANALAGTVRLSVPEVMGIEIIPQMLEPLRTTHPGIAIELDLSNRQADLLHQEVDLAVRTVQPRQGALVAKKAASIPFGFFASRNYLDRKGMPKNLDDLKTHDFIAPDRNIADLEYLGAFSQVLNLERIKVRTDSHPAQISLARAGLGVILAQTPFCALDPRLIHILPEVVPFHLDAYLVTHENLARVPRVRAVFDRLVAGFDTMMGPHRKPRTIP